MTTKNLRCSLCGNWRKKYYKILPTNIKRLFNNIQGIIYKNKPLRHCNSCKQFIEDTEEHNGNITRTMMLETKSNFYKQYYFLEDNKNTIYIMPTFKEMMGDTGDIKGALEGLLKGISKNETSVSKNETTKKNKNKDKKLRAYIG